MIGNLGFFRCKIAILIITIALVLFTNCSNALNNPSLYYGTWQNVRDGYTMTITLSKESWIGKTDISTNYTIDNLSWVSATNDDPATKVDYPNGFYISGTVTEVNNTSGLSIGEQYTYKIYMNRNKAAFLRKQEDGTRHVFTKIE